MASNPPKKPARSLEEKLKHSIAELHDMHRAYRALERLVAPAYVDEKDEKVPVSSAEMTALLRTLNAEMKRRRDAFQRTLRAIQARAERGEDDVE